MYRPKWCRIARPKNAGNQGHMVVALVGDRVREGATECNKLIDGIVSVWSQ